MNTRAEAYVGRTASKVIDSILEQQENNNMNKKYTPLTGQPYNVKLNLKNAEGITGIHFNRIKLDMREYLSEEYQKERQDKFNEINRLNEQWSVLFIKRAKIEAEMAKYQSIIDTTKPKLKDKPELVNSVVEAEQTLKALEAPITEINSMMTSLENLMNQHNKVVNDKLVKQSKSILESVARYREELDKEEAFAKSCLEVADNALKGKFELPEELAELIKVPETDDYGATVLNKGSLDHGIQVVPPQVVSTLVEDVYMEVPNSN